MGARRAPRRGGGHFARGILERQFELVVDQLVHADLVDPQKKEWRLVEVTPEGKRDVAKLPTEVGIDAYGNVRPRGVVQGGGADAQRFLAYEGQVV